MLPLTKEMLFQTSFHVSIHESTYDTSIDEEVPNAITKFEA
jgi:hypothetical protein